ncbi:hypothetical protein EDD18DRAFT_1113661 [Armillaria luteobubalina]|uniref:Uncharacterized protein n=1 Tax=Armillaria luteobubalina TaxID=153913 RepID=A0AA39P9Y6_9AGAR|nr:hypothetical protein EDD18DRAFT_1113661 [Armillaria luteobubalina]
MLRREIIRGMALERRGLEEQESTLLDFEAFKRDTKDAMTEFMERDFTDDSAKAYKSQRRHDILDKWCGITDYSPSDDEDKEREEENDSEDEVEAFFMSMIILSQDSEDLFIVLHIRCMNVHCTLRTYTTMRWRPSQCSYICLILQAIKVFFQLLYTARPGTVFRMEESKPMKSLGVPKLNEGSTRIEQIVRLVQVFQ